MSTRTCGFLEFREDFTVAIVFELWCNAPSGLTNIVLPKLMYNHDHFYVFYHELVDWKCRVETKSQTWLRLRPANLFF